MQIGMIGLGRMGADMARRLINAGHRCVVWDISPEAVSKLAGEGAVGAGSLQELVDALPAPRIVWIMIPAAHVGATLDRLTPLLSPGDAVIDGGNSFYQNDIDRGIRLKEHGIAYVDAGVSGGTHGLERGYCLMVGCAPETFVRIEPLLQALAPGVEAAPRSPGREGVPATEEMGYLRCGDIGSGHFVKMVHNGIEYGLMAAYAEGLNLLRNGGAGRKDLTRDAETAPLENPEYYRFNIPLDRVTELWRRGSVVPSWLLDLIAEALHASPELNEFKGRVSDSGEGRWTVHAGVDTGTPLPVITAALYSRFDSRGEAHFAGQVLSALRKGFGGHSEKDAKAT